MTPPHISAIEMRLLLSVAPAAVERVHRLQFAIDQLSSGVSRTEVYRRLKGRYRVSSMTAWRITTMAIDLTVTDEDQQK